MIDKKISVSEQVSNLSDKAKVIFTWSIPHADDFGILPYQALTLKATIVPMMSIIISDFKKCIDEILKQKLWLEEEYNSQKFYKIAKFYEHQTLKKDRKPNTILKTIDSWSVAEELGLTTASRQRTTQKLENLFEDYLSRNLYKIENDLILQKRQFRVKGEGEKFCLIDILAKDKQGKDVLIEIKVIDVSDTSVIWQINDYRTLYESQENRAPRCIVIAPSFTKIIEKEAWNKNIELFRLELPDFQMEKAVFPKLREEKLREEKDCAPHPPKKDKPDKKATKKKEVSEEVKILHKEAVELIDFWRKKYEDSMGQKPIISAWARYIKQAKPFIKTLGLPRMKMLCEGYFATFDDKLFKSSGWSINVFLIDSTINKLQKKYS